MILKSPSGSALTSRIRDVVTDGESFFSGSVIGSVNHNKLTLAAMVAGVADYNIGDTVTTKENTTGNGGGGVWDVVDATTVTENEADIVTGDATRSFQLRTNQIIDVRTLGVVGDGLTDNSDGIQRAETILSSTGGTIVLSAGANSDYRVTKHAGTNDKWGINIKSSNVHLMIEDGASLRRLSSDISTNAKSFPLLLIGVPDDDLIGSQITNVKVKGGEFIGEDVRHSTSGNTVMDGRQAIWIKNTKKCTIYGCEFTSIDSSAIYIQSPGELDNENTVFYNKTKCYDIKIIKNDFFADSHSTNGRALLHAIVTKADRVKILDNSFEWCDVCISAEGTYESYDDVETDTYNDPNLLPVNTIPVNRTGKGLTIANNDVYNSSEHCYYLNGMGISCTGGTITVDNTTVCNTPQIQIRGRNVTVTGITMTNVYAAASITAGAMDVTFAGNHMDVAGDSAGGAINIQSQGLKTFIDNRAWFTTYTPMKNISVSGVINMPEASQTNGYGIRLFSDTSDASFPDGQMQNVNLNVTINNPRIGILNFANMAKRVKINNCIFNGKPFTEAGFTTGTTMNSLAVLAVDDSLASPLSEVTFDNNTIYGFEQILHDNGGAGSAGTILPPYGVRGNKMDYIKTWDTAAFAAPGWETMFYNNQGVFFLDRTGWFGNRAINNSLSDGTSNSEKKTMIQLVSSTDVRIYHDDAGGFKAL